MKSSVVQTAVYCAGRLLSPQNTRPIVLQGGYIYIYIYVVHNNCSVVIGEGAGDE